MAKKSAQDEDVGILFGNRVIALRPVEVASTDYAERGYGVGSGELKRALTQLHAKGQKNRKVGKSRHFTGDIEAALDD